MASTCVTANRRLRRDLCLVSHVSCCPPCFCHSHTRCLVYVNRRLPRVFFSFLTYHGLCLACATRIVRWQEISKKESTLAIEKRTYMKGWLKKIFVGQAVISTVLGGLMVSYHRCCRFGTELIDWLLVLPCNAWQFLVPCCASSNCLQYLF